MKKYLTEQALLEGCLEQRPEAQRELYQRFARVMFGLCMRYTHDKMEAEDTLQIGFMKVFENLNKFNGGSLEGWMRRIFVRTAIDRYRWRQRDIFNLALEPEENHAISLDDVVGQMALDELVTLINSLPDGCRLVFNLYAVEGYAHAEIATMLNIHEGTSRSQYARAKALLKDKVFAKTNG